MKFKYIFLLAIFLWFVLCSLTHPSNAHSSPSLLQPGSQASHGSGPAETVSADADLTPAQAYAAEVLAYLVQITLGMAGDPEYREQWRVRGLEEPLRFQDIEATMTEPEQNPLDLMVLDPNILDLTSVLYYYDKGLSLYQGDYGVTSIYPASEFIAIRLLLLKKIHSGKKVGLAALVAREDLLRDPEAEPTEEDLRATNLTIGELKLLQEIIHSKPHLFQYLKSPFLVAAFYNAGAVVEDGFVREKMARAGYGEYPCRPFLGSDRPEAVKICFLPSIIDEFVYGQPNAHLSPNAFQPTGFFRDMIRKLARDIRSATKKCMEKELLTLGNTQSPTKISQWNADWSRIAGKYLGFYVADQRPFVVYPENAAQVIQDICPQADFTVFILGKNVYKSIFLDPKTDIYPSANRIYVDITDIKHSRIQEEIRDMGCFVSKRIVERLLAARINGTSLIRK
ncbi:MAG: hypothetical protein JRL30_14550 [Deltaproteobacteria bacterium]|nr:hypothetical protein [Deltaproteobacteria bacterium]